jgi:hypothetical protein
MHPKYIDWKNITLKKLVISLKYLYLLSNKIKKKIQLY